MTGRCLVTNASGEAHSIITHEDAICLVLGEKATVLEESSRVFHSQHVTMKAPSVIQLNRYVNLPADRRQVMLTRKNVCARDRFICAYCGDRGETIDHVIPKAKGGTHAWTNVTAACRACNQRKGRRTLEELGWTLDREMYKPDGIAVYLRSLNPQPEWEPYLT